MAKGTDGKAYKTKYTNKHPDGRDKTTVEIFEEVISGQRHLLPKGFWSPEDPKSFERFKDCVKYLIDKLEIPAHQIPIVTSDSEFFKKNGLRTPLQQLVDHVPFNVVGEIYPNIRPWEMGDISEEVFLDENDYLEATRWFLTVKFNYDRKKLISNLNVKAIFVSNGWRTLPFMYLEYLEEYIFNYHEGLAVIELIIKAFPEWDLKETDFKSFRRYHKIPVSKSTATNKKRRI